MLYLVVGYEEGRVLLDMYFNVMAVMSLDYTNYTN